MILHENEKYIKFDTVKIKAHKKCLLETYLKFNEQFDSKTGEKTGIVYCSKDNNETQYNLFIGVSYYHKTLTLEFSSKILIEDYPKLISKYTIRTCLENINKLGICKIDVDSILTTGCFTNLHVTKDTSYELNNEILNALNDNVKNYKRYKWNRYLNNGITFTKDVTSSDCKESITLYNKEKEINATADRRAFLNSLKNKEDIVEHFKGKTRFEIRLSTQKKIKTYLQISDTLINTVLDSVANPILLQFNKVFGESTNNIQSDIDIDNWENNSMYLFLKQYDFDLKLAEQKLRRLYTSDSGYYDRKNKIEKIYWSLQSKESTDYISELRNLLL